MSLQQQRIAALCEELKLPVMSAEWSALAQRAADTQASFADFLNQVEKPDVMTLSTLNPTKCDT